jgi:hypothetical protein
MVLLGTVCEPHIIHPMQGPLRVPSLAQAVVGYPGVEVEAGPLVAAEGSVVGNSRFQWLRSINPEQTPGYRPGKVEGLI